MPCLSHPGAHTDITAGTHPLPGVVEVACRPQRAHPCTAARQQRIAIIVPACGRRRADHSLPQYEGARPPQTITYPVVVWAARYNTTRWFSSSTCYNHNECGEWQVHPHFTGAHRVAGWYDRYGGGVTWPAACGWGRAIDAPSHCLVHPCRG
jgi:hypothetical protein